MNGRTVGRTWEYQSRLDAPARYRRACRYEAFIPNPLRDLELTLALETAGMVAEAEQAIHDLNAQARPALAPLSRLLLRTESIASSRVEGLQLDTRDLARAEVRAEAGGRLGGTAEEILANIDAMEMAIEESSAAETVGEAEILAIHGELMRRASRKGIAGRFRTEQNWIGGNDYNPCGADFVPPPPEHLPELLADLYDALADDTLPPLVQAALVHAQFETIHPFDDGNGRTGRALIHVVLKRRGVATAYVPPISIVLSRSRDRYIQGLTAYREGRTEAWLEHFAAAATTAARLASRYLAAVRDLTAYWERQLAASSEPPRSDAAAWLIIRQLPAHPVITGPVAAAAVDRSRPQVYQALDQLEGAGILIPLTSGRRNRVWEAAGLLDLLARLEAGEAPG